MILRCRQYGIRNRRGVAAVEMALVTMLFVVPVLIGVLELGRMIQVQQIVSNSAREGARLAGQGYTINATGGPTQIMADSGTTSVKSTVYQYLIAAGLTDLQPSDVTVTFSFTRPNTAGNTPTEPYLGEKNQPFTVTVEVNWDKVRWVNLGLVNPQKIQFSATWQMLVDEPFTVNGTLPTW
jgi:Flp pilus assembly protein TadG